MLPNHPAEGDGLLRQPEEDWRNRSMSATNTALRAQIRGRPGEPIIEAMAVRGLLFGLLMVAPFWFLIATLALAVF